MDDCENKPASYVLMSGAGDYLYKGSCRDLAQRMSDHHAGRVQCTKGRRPLVLVYHEYCETYTEARKRENFLKSGQGRAWLKKFLDEQK